MEILSAGDVSSMSLCLCVLAAAAWPNDNNNLPFSMGVDDIHRDELNLILTMKSTCEHSPQMSNLWFTNTIQFSTTLFSRVGANLCCCYFPQHLVCFNVRGFICIYVQLVAGICRNKWTVLHEKRVLIHPRSHFTVYRR